MGTCLGLIMSNIYNRIRQVLFGSIILLVISGCATTQDKPTIEQLDAKLVLDENGCYVGEGYDEIDDSCYFDCTELSDEECDIQYDSFYSGLDSFIADDFQGHDDIDTDEIDSREIAKYAVNKSLELSAISNLEPANEASYREIWSVATSILPTAFLSKEVVEYHVTTDGADNTLAFVVLNDDEVEKWNFAIDPADYGDSNNKDFIHTIIHEFAHIAFLNSTQVDLTEYESCENYWITEGCTYPESYINQYYDEFWADIIQDNPSALADEDAENEDEVYEFYEKYQSHFVSDYAATNPVEDAAEVFVHFVLGSNPLQPKTISDKKIAFLHQFPELLKFRNIIRIKLKKQQPL